MTSITEAGGLSDQRVENRLRKIEGDVAWLTEYFTPDDDGSDRFSRIEDRLGNLEAKMDMILEKL